MTIERKQNLDATRCTMELEQCGLVIENRLDAVERLEEASNWRFALGVMARNGERLRIFFRAPVDSMSRISSVLLNNGFSKEAAEDYAKLFCCS